MGLTPEQMKKVKGLNCRVLVSDMQVLSLTAALYFDYRMFYAADAEAWSRLQAILSRSGEGSLLLVTRSLKPAGPVGITVAAPSAPEVPVTGWGDVVFLPFELKPAERLK